MMPTKGQTNKRKRGPTATKVCPTTEWTDFHGILLLFGLRRSTAYHLCKTEPMLQGASISLKGEHETRGKRLFNVKLFRRFLESKLPAGDGGLLLNELPNE